MLKFINCVSSWFLERYGVFCSVLGKTVKCVCQNFIDGADQVSSVFGLDGGQNVEWLYSNGS